MIELPVHPEHLTAQLVIHRPRMMLPFCTVCLVSSLVKPHAVQLVNVCVWVAPNAILLRHNCQWFEPFVIWSAFTSWTCWNTIFLIMLIEAHNCAPWDKGRAITRGGQSVLASLVTCRHQTRSSSCQAHMQCWVMLTARFCGVHTCINSYNMKGNRKQAVITGCFSSLLLHLYGSESCDVRSADQAES